MNGSHTVAGLCNSAESVQVPPGVRMQKVLNSCTEFIPNALTSVQLKMSSLVLQFVAFLYLIVVNFN